MARFSYALFAAALALPALAQQQQQQPQQQQPQQQQPQQRQNVTTGPAESSQGMTPAAPAPQQNATTGAPAQQQQPTNATTGGGGGARPSAMSQLEVLLLGNHSWFDPNHTLQFFQNDYQVVNHSPHEICNVTLSAPLENPQQTWMASSYNVHLSNSTRKRGIDIFAPQGNQHSIPANGILNFGYILMKQLQGGAADSNTTSMAGGSLHGGALPTVESAQYCDEMMQQPTGAGGNMTTGGAQQGMQGNTTTDGTQQGMQGNTTTGGGAQQGMQGNTTTGGAQQGMQGNATTGGQGTTGMSGPGNATTTTNTTATTPAPANESTAGAGAGTGGKIHKKKPKLRSL